MSKSFWNKEPKPLTPEQLAIERKLLPRLKLMGYIFLFLCFSSLIFVIFIQTERSSVIGPFTEEFGQASILEATIATPLLIDEADDELAVEATEVLNFYIVSALFASIGMVCFYMAKRKRRELYQEGPVLEEKKKEDLS